MSSRHGTCTNCGRTRQLVTLTECGACYGWRYQHGYPRPTDRPTTLQDRPSTSFTSKQVCACTGVTYRQLDLWQRTGRITPTLQDAEGSGTVRLWTAADVQYIAAVVERLDWGMTLDAAFRTDDPPVPSPALKESA